MAAALAKFLLNGEREREKGKNGEIALYLSLIVEKSLSVHPTKEETRIGARYVT